jgi:hypothetical protein
MVGSSSWKITVHEVGVANKRRELGLIGNGTDEGECVMLEISGGGSIWETSDLTNHTPIWRKF